MNTSSTMRDNAPPAALLTICKALFPAALAAVLTAGCAGVQPWERGPLSDYIMRSDRDALADGLYEHVYFTREAAAGGRGVGGGGCGCN